MTSNSTLSQVYLALITAANILSFHNVIYDGFGHVSVRNPENPNTYLVQYKRVGASPTEYYVENSTLVDPNAPPSSWFSEHYIHGEIFKRYPDINNAVHSHSEAVIPYADSHVPLRPTYHMTGFLGTKVPVFDIADYYLPGNLHNMLINSIRLGRILASYFDSKNGTDPGTDPSPDYTVVLQRGHGFTTLGTSLEEAVYRAIYTQRDAEVQSTALTIHAAAYGSGENFMDNGIKYLSAQEAADSMLMDDNSMILEIAWEVWQKEVQSSSFYT
ncbi:MAG: hypothetical protein M1834_001214 [Cirrosporium novae-zelandiae]|nr:MAG: hypothetical protein M1834_001214 [Cirrosporium novae-zelandiae]